MIVARRRVYSLEELKRRAIRLRMKGVRPKEIATRLGSGHSPWVIRNWLREAGVPAAIRARALELSADKKTLEVANALGLSQRRVQKILQEAKGPVREYKGTEEHVDLFVSDPYSHMKARFTQSRAFGRALVRRCGEAVEKNPKGGLAVVEPSIELFDRIRKTRLKEIKARRALCFFVQSQGIEAYAYQLMGQFVIALQKLQEAIRGAGGCVACEAEELWRFGLLYLDWGRWPQSYSALKGAIERYRSLPDAGHDLLGNGVANCMLARAGCLYHTVGPEAGAVEARGALKILTGKESPLLFVALVMALAKCLQPSKNPRAVEESQALLEWCFDHLESARSHPVARMFLYMLKGHLLAVKGRREEAIESLTLALEDAQACERQNEIGLIVADLGLLDPDPRNVRSQIEDFCDWDDDGELILPPWCRSLESEIRSLYEEAKNHRRPIDVSAFVALREAAGGEARMPSFIVPASSAGSHLHQTL